jgi:hypothetical protein
MTRTSPISRAQSAVLAALVWAISLSYGFSSWGIYRAHILLHGEEWKWHLSGGIRAPFQYRIGSWIVVDWLNRLAGIKPYDTLTLIDVLCLAGSLWIVLLLTVHADSESTALPKNSLRLWFRIAVVLLLAEYYLAWGHWFQSPEMMPSVLFVAISLALVTGKFFQKPLLPCLLLLLLSLVQSFFRADVAVILNTGFFLAILLFRKLPVPLGRMRLAITCAVAALAAGCVQIYLMRVRFPHATYGPEHVVQITTNLRPGMWLTMLLTLLPYFVLWAILLRKRFHPSAPLAMLLTASLLYFVLWFAVGQLDETRIFIPFAFALLPATAMTLEQFANLKNAGVPAGGRAL